MLAAYLLHDRDFTDFSMDDNTNLLQSGVGQIAVGEQSGRISSEQQVCGKMDNQHLIGASTLDLS